MPEDPNSADEWPPEADRLRGILWRVERHLLAGDYVHASVALDDARGLGEQELRAGLRHLAAAGYRAEQGELDRARRQLERARRRLAPLLPEAHEVEIAPLFEALESAHRELAQP
jgi:hypothetical protein